MVIDTSAVVAVVKGGAEADAVVAAIRDQRPRLMSAATFVELFLVLDNTGDPAGVGRVEALLDLFQVEVVDVTADQARIARQAHRDFGRGRHAARLNFGDCFAYALAKSTRQPLLFVGDDFAHTDVRPALR